MKFLEVGRYCLLLGRREFMQLKRETPDEIKKLNMSVLYLVIKFLIVLLCLQSKSKTILVVLNSSFQQINKTIT